MNEEEKTTPTAEPAAEKQTKPAKPKRTDEEKLQDPNGNVSANVPKL